MTPFLAALAPYAVKGIIAGVAYLVGLFHGKHSAKKGGNLNVVIS
jgi:hypothetical protein